MLCRNHIICFVLLVSLIPFKGFAQEKEVRKADVKFELLQYNIAAGLYKEALGKFDEDNRQKEYVMFRLAECYRLMNNPDSARVLYSELASGSFGNIKPELYLRYADNERAMGNVDEAEKYYRKFLKAVPHHNEARLGIASCEWIRANKENRSPATVAEVKVLNSTADDFAAGFLSDECNVMVYTSNRELSTGKYTDQWSGMDFSDLFQATHTGEGWTQPQLLKAGEAVNSASHEGTPDVSHSQGEIYFTRCIRMRDRDKYCMIVKSRKENEVWLAPVEVLSDSAANVGHPALSSDGLLMIFSSDRDGSRGGKDLWAVRRKSVDDEFGRPVNLGGTINTTGDEMFPSLYKDSILFFSSDGLPGCGGLDIFKSLLEGNGWGEPVNLLTPINSGYDDFRLVTCNFAEHGYFTSNRNGGTGGDDLYRYDRRDYVFTVSGKVIDGTTLLSLPGCQVMLINEETGDTTFTITCERGNFAFDTTEVDGGYNYQVVARKPEYFSDRKEISTKGYRGDREFTVSLTLDQIPDQPIVLPDILFPLDEWTLEPQYQDSLMQLVEILNENPELVIELRSHTDSRASLAYNDQLSQKRAQAVVDFLISKDIDPGRLVARGYGERIPRILQKDILKEGYLFEEGTLLDDEYIESLPTEELREAAFHLNRRTEFTVLAKNYDDGFVSEAGSTDIIVVTDTTGREISYTPVGNGRMKVNCFINDYSAEAIIDPASDRSYIDEMTVLELLQKGGVGRDDFEGDFEAMVVDDRITEGAVVWLDKVRIGETVINSTPVTVKGNNGKLLIIGRDMIEKAGEMTVDRVNNTISFK